MNKHQIIRSVSVAFILGLAFVLYNIDTASVNLLLAGSNDSKTQCKLVTEISYEDDFRFSTNFDYIIAEQAERIINVCSIRPAHIRSQIFIPLIRDNISRTANEEIRFIEFPTLKNVKVGILPLFYFGN